MPIARIADKLVYFAHVPKCAGTAIEDYLQARFGTLGFLDRHYLQTPAAGRWTRSSPQHVPAAALARLLPPTFFAQSFAVIRHPVTRVASVFRHQRDIERFLPEDADFGDWLGSLAGHFAETPFYLDNHPRPMAEIVPEAATLFRIEDGLEPMIDWLDGLAGQADGPREVPEMNRYGQRLASMGRKEGRAVEVTEACRARIAELYAADFERFGYAPDSV